MKKNQSKLIRHKFTESLNKGELHYRKVIQPQENEFKEKSNWIKRVHNGRVNLLPALYKNVKFKGKILELGAGSCWFGSELSRIESVEEVYCLDISEYILKEVAPLVMDSLGAETKKITRVIGDFNKLDFKDKKFDFVVFDAGLHHIPTEDFTKVMKEIYRVLKDDGKLVGINEPFLNNIIFVNKIQRKRFGLHEKKYGVNENIYTKKEWEYMFTIARFKVDFIPYDNIQIDGRFTIKNLIKKIIKYTPLKKVFYYLSPRYFIILRKN
jgi:ubiquinone/menaquinone biosynthesis C-methylase UbiE